MNLAALWQLPVLFVCENNLYAMGTALTLSESVTDLTHKAASYAVAAAAVDGMDVLAVEAAAQDAAAAVRAGAGPYFLECRTYRFRAHSMFDAELYRDKKPRSSVEAALSHPDVDAAFGGAGAAQRCGPHGDRTARRSRSRGGGGVRRSGDLGAGGGSDPLCVLRTEDYMNGDTQGMRQLTYREAVREAMREAMHKDARVFLMGEDVGRYGAASPSARVCWRSSARSVSVIPHCRNRLSLGLALAQRWAACVQSSRS